MVNLIPSSISNEFRSSGIEPGLTPKANTLTVSDKTTLKELQGFLAKGTANDEVRGHMVNGSLVLYTKPANPKDPGGRIQTALNHFVSSSAQQKRGLGQAGIETILKQHLGAEKAATSRVTKALDEGAVKSVKVGSMLILAEIAGTRTMVDRPLRNEGPKVSDLGMTKEQMSHSMEAAAKLFKSGDIDGAVKLLGKDFAAAFEKTGPNGSKRDAFALSFGEKFKHEIGMLLKEHHVSEPPKQGDKFNLSLPEKIYAAVGSQVGRGNFNDGGELVLDGKTYVKAGNLGAGGGGSVDLYINKDDRADRLAFKIAGTLNRGYNEQQHDILFEIEKHQGAYANDQANVVPIRAGVQLPDGRFGLAMDVAELGDMKSAIKALDAAEKKGDITPTQSMAARLTLLQDGLKGIQTMHEAGEVHRDMKPENLFVFSGGVAKVADLGEARSTTNFNVFNPDGQSEPYVAREIFSAHAIGKAAEQAMTKMDAFTLRTEMQQKDNPALSGKGLSPMQASARDMLVSQMPGLDNKAVDDLLKDLKVAVRRNVGANAIDPMMRDAFAMGITAFQMGAGELPSEKWNAGPDAVLSQNSSVKIATDGIRDTALKAAAENLVKLADDMTHSNKAERKDLTGALQSPAFNLEGVGSPETRKLIDTVLRQAKNLDENYLPLPKANAPVRDEAIPTQIIV